MKRLLLLPLVLTGTSAFGLSVAGPPPPPLGWEEAVTPGFDPPIEETLVFQYGAQPAEQQQFAEGWGDAAVPVLRELMADPKWGEYKAVIEAYLSLLGAEAFEADAEAFVRDSFARIRQGEEIDAADTKILYRLAGDATDAMRETVRAAFAAADAEQQARMSHWVTWFAGDDRISFLETCLEVTKAEPLRNQIEMQIESVRAHARALEPMANVLDAEPQP